MREEHDGARDSAPPPTPCRNIAVAKFSFRVRLLALSPERMRHFRWRHVSIVFQSAMNSLNPVLSVGDQFVDTLSGARDESSKRQALNRAGELLKLVGIDPSRT